MTLLSNADPSYRDSRGNSMNLLDGVRSSRNAPKGEVYGGSHDLNEYLLGTSDFPEKQQRRKGQEQHTMSLNINNLNGLGGFNSQDGSSNKSKYISHKLGKNHQNHLSLAMLMFQDFNALSIEQL